MRAGRVKPGHIVKDDEGVWQVVVAVDVRKADPARQWADNVTVEFANGEEEGCPVSENYEAVRLTEAQVAALRTVGDDGLYRLTEQRTGARSWWAYGERTGSPVPLARIVELGLIEPDSTKPSETWQDKNYDYFVLSPSGRALLDLLDKEARPRV